MYGNFKYGNMKYANNRNHLLVVSIDETLNFISSLNQSIIHKIRKLISTTYLKNQLITTISESYIKNKTTILQYTKNAITTIKSI